MLSGLDRIHDCERGNDSESRALPSSSLLTITSLTIYKFPYFISIMDTRTTSPAIAEQPRLATPPPVQDKISAYYSLVFPHFTFYIQTLSITIGRRCAPNAATSSTADQSQVDVDLGALKSVSRLHAKIEYDQEEDRFVLAVIGRNGAWVDGVWSGTGTRAPLGER